MRNGARDDRSRFQHQVARSQVQCGVQIVNASEGHTVNNHAVGEAAYMQHPISENTEIFAVLSAQALHQKKTTTTVLNKYSPYSLEFTLISISYAVQDHPSRMPSHFHL